MDFYLRIDKSGRLLAAPEIIFSEADNHSTLEFVQHKNGFSWILGDPVYPSLDRKTFHSILEDGKFGKFIRAVDGFYFLLHWNEQKKQLVISSSMFNILPVYYLSSNNLLIISSSFDLLRQTEAVEWTPDEQYYLEKALFYYPLFTRTPLKQINTVPSNHLLVYQDNLSFSRHTHISDYYVENPVPWTRSLDHLAEMFIEQARKFIPVAPFCATLTGGFDGRTSISVAMEMNRSFFTYSYGSETSMDVKIPLLISREMGITHKPLILDKTYTKQHFWKNGMEFLTRSYGLGNISRAHYYYALQTVLKDTRYLVSGNFGSEIIRSMKVPGVMTSALLFNLFENPDRSQLRKQILASAGTKYLSPNLVDRWIDPLLDEIYDYLSNLPGHLSANKRFYIYLFEEVFSKYFGPEITVQRQFLNHRAPFLSFRFIEVLLKTGMAGVYSEYRENNPFNRYHGQVLYAHILKRTAPGWLDLPLDRGYKPRYFLTPAGPIQIALGFTIRKLMKKSRAPFLTIQ